MIRSVISGALRFRGLVLGLAAAIIVVGAVTLRDAPVDVYPEFTPPYVEIQTESLGLSAAEVEQLLTVPLEADLLNGVEGVDVLRSQSLPGMSSIVLVFEPGFDLYKGRQLVQERLTQLGGAAFPNISKPPTMLPPLSSSSRVLMIGLSSKELSGIDKSVLARWTVRPRLMGVDGVANVSIWGMRDQQIQVQVDPRRLRDRGVTLQQVVATAGNAQVASPVSYLEGSVPGTGGFIETPQQRLGVRNVFDNIATPSQLGRVPVEGGGGLRLTDVADVVEDHQPLIGDAVVGDDEGLLLVVEKFPGADAKSVTEGVEEALEKLKPGLSGIEVDTSVFRPASFIDEAGDNLQVTLIAGAVLLILALVAFLLQWRTVLIALITIPVSLVAAALVLDAVGETFNAISITGLAIALAVVIDDAVAGAEAAGRRLRERPGGASVQAVVVDATHEIRRPLAYAGLITLLAIVPLAVMEGRPGDFFSPLAVAYALGVLAAMATALMVVPALSALLPARREGAVPGAKLAAAVAAAVGRLLRRRALVLGAVGAGAAGVLIALPLMDSSPVPQLKDRDVLVRLTTDPGTSQPRMTQIATQVTDELRALDGVETAGAHVGRAVTGDRIVDVNSADVVVGVDPDADHDATMAAIERVASQVQGARADVATYSEQRVRQVGALDEGENPAAGSDDLDVLTGAGRPLMVRVYGQEEDVLEEQAQRLQRVVAEVDGVKDPRIEQVPTQATLDIEVDVDEARRYGVKPGDVRRAAAIMVQGILVGSVFQEQRVFDVMVQGTDELRENQEALRNLLIDRPGGGHVRLNQLADVRVNQSPTVIERESVSRKLDITMDVSGRSIDDVADDLEQRLLRVDMPFEYHAEVLDNTVADEINEGQIIAFSAAALIAMFLLLQAALRSWRLAAAAFVTLPAALAGGVVGALALGDGLTLGAMAGLLALFAIAARNALTVMERLHRLDPGGALDPDVVRRGVQERVVPVLASTAGIAAVLAPFAVLGGDPGLEILNPMAIVVLCGLVTTTAMALLALPVLYAQARTAERPADEEAGPSAAELELAVK